MLPDDYNVRNKVLTDLHRHARSWLKAGLARAPLEMRGLLQVSIADNQSLRSLLIGLSSQNYIDGPPGEFHSPTFGDDEMGKSVAIDLVRLSPSNVKGGACYFDQLIVC